MRKFLDIIVGFFEGFIIIGIIIFGFVFVINKVHDSERENDFDKLKTSVLESGNIRIAYECTVKETIVQCWISDGTAVNCSNAYTSAYKKKIKYVWEFEPVAVGTQTVCIEVFDSQGDFNRVDIYDLKTGENMKLTYSLSKNTDQEFLKEVHSTMKKITA